MGELNERKLKILEALITDYILYGDPVSSRSLAKKHGLGISSATIRNEMSDLMDMGFIKKTHASSGRVPSDKGYRLHVNMAKQRELTEEEAVLLAQAIRQNINHMEYLMKETAKALATLTKYAAIVSEIKQKLTLHYVQLIPMDSHRIVVVVITAKKLVKNTMINAEAPPVEILNELTAFLNKILQNKTAEEISSIKIKSRPYKVLLEDIISAIGKILTLEEEVDIFTGGVENILGYPEFKDIDKARSLFKVFEEKELLLTVLNKNSSHNVQVIIGSENTLKELQDCSIIKANYMIGDNAIGAIGIIGPTRMDYQAVMSLLREAVNLLETKSR